MKFQTEICRLPPYFFFRKALKCHSLSQNANMNLQISISIFRFRNLIWLYCLFRYFYFICFLWNNLLRLVVPLHRLNRLQGHKTIRVLLEQNLCPPDFHSSGGILSQSLSVSQAFALPFNIQISKPVVQLLSHSFHSDHQIRVPSNKRPFIK